MLGRILGNAQILVVAHVRVKIQPFQATGNLVSEPQTSKQIGFIGQLALERVEIIFRIRFFYFFILFIPSLIAFKNVRKLPFQVFRDFLSFQHI